MTEMLPGDPAIRLYPCKDPRYLHCRRPAGQRCVDSKGQPTTPHGFRWAQGQAYADAYNLLNPQIAKATTALATAKAQNTDLATKATQAAEDLVTIRQQLEAEIRAHGEDTAALKAALDRIDDLEHPDPTPSKPTTLMGYWPGGSAAAPQDEDGDKDIDWYDDYFRVQKYIGPARVLRDFPTGLPKSFVGSRADNLKLKAVVQSYSQVPLADWVSGKAGDQLAATLDTVPDDVHCWFCIHHEPWPEWTTAQIIAAWTKTLPRLPKKANLHPTFIPMRYDLQVNRFSEDALVDGIEVFGPDAYLTSNTPTPAETLEPLHDIAVKHGLRFGVSEVSKAAGFKMKGLTEDASAAALATYLRDTVAGEWGADYVTWFESNKSDGDWRIEQYPTAVGILRAAVAAS